MNTPLRLVVTFTTTLVIVVLSGHQLGIRFLATIGAAALAVGAVLFVRRVEDVQRRRGRKR